MSLLINPRFRFLVLLPVVTNTGEGIYYPGGLIYETDGDARRLA